MTTDVRAGVPGHGVIVVGCDGSPAGEAAMDYAVAEAVRRDARLVAVAAYAFPPAVYSAGMAPVSLYYDPKLAEDTEKMARTSLDSAIRRAGNPALKDEVVVREGRPSAVLLDAGTDADLLIVGARGAGLWERLMMGSTCNEVVHHSHGPVLVVPSPKL